MTAATNHTITLTALDLLLVSVALLAGLTLAAVVALAVITWAPEAWILGICRLLRIPVVDLDHVDEDHRPFIDQAARFGLVTNTGQEPPCTR